MKRPNGLQIFVLIIIAAVILRFFIPVFIYSWLLPAIPSLDPLPAPDEAPSHTVTPLEVEPLILNTILIDFWGGTPHQGPYHLGFDLELNVSNTGSYDIVDFNTVKASIFTKDLTHVYTFDVSTEENATIASETHKILSYDVNNRVSRDTLLSGKFFLRLLVTFNIDQEAIITTPSDWIMVITE